MNKFKSTNLSFSHTNDANLLKILYPQSDDHQAYLKKFIECLMQPTEIGPPLKNRAMHDRSISLSRK